MKTQEMFTVSGVAPDVQYARAAAWNGLRLVLGSEDEEQWALTQAMYSITEVESETGEPEAACRYTITMARVNAEVEA